MKQSPIQEGLTYDDVLLVPQYSEILPSDADLSTTLGHVTLRLPIISAPMDTVTEAPMAIAMGEAGAIGVIHKNMSPAEQSQQVATVVQSGQQVGAAVSVSDDEFERAKQVIEAGAVLIIVDSAHGHSKGVLAQVERLKKEFGDRITLVGGNVASAEGTKALIQAGADVVKIGVGPGSICTTRVVAGVGMPQLSAVMNAVSVAKKSKTPIIADGGIKYSGDIVKALAAGASAIMAGGLFAGTDQAPGDIVEIDGEKMKTYRGMGSTEAMQHGSKDRYGQKDTTAAKKLVPEGIVGYKPYRGNVEDIIYQLAGGIRSGMGYNGAATIADLQQNAEFVRMSAAGFSESHPHSLKHIQTSSNYGK